MHWRWSQYEYCHAGFTLPFLLKGVPLLLVFPGNPSAEKAQKYENLRQTCFYEGVSAGMKLSSPPSMVRREQTGTGSTHGTITRLGWVGGRLEGSQVDGRRVARGAERKSFDCQQSLRPNFQASLQCIILFWGERIVLREFSTLPQQQEGPDSNLTLIEKEFPFPRKTLHFVFFPRENSGVWDPVWDSANFILTAPRSLQTPPH